MMITPSPTPLQDVQNIRRMITEVEKCETGPDLAYCPRLGHHWQTICNAASSEDPTPSLSAACLAWAAIGIFLPNVKALWDCLLRHDPQALNTLRGTPETLSKAVSADLYPLVWGTWQELEEWPNDVPHPPHLKPLQMDPHLSTELSALTERVLRNGFWDQRGEASEVDKTLIRHVFSDPKRITGHNDPKELNLDEVIWRWHFVRAAANHREGCACGSPVLLAAAVIYKKPFADLLRWMMAPRRSDEPRPEIDIVVAPHGLNEFFLSSARRATSTQPGPAGPEPWSAYHDGQSGHSPRRSLQVPPPRSARGRKVVASAGGPSKTSPWTHSPYAQRPQRKETNAQPPQRKETNGGRKFSTSSIEGTVPMSPPPHSSSIKEWKKEAREKYLTKQSHKVRCSIYERICKQCWGHSEFEAGGHMRHACSGKKKDRSTGSCKQCAERHTKCEFEVLSDESTWSIAELSEEHAGPHSPHSLPPYVLVQTGQGAGTVNRPTEEHARRYSIPPGKDEYQRFTGISISI
ncbi:hypothetical protein CALVIDRAFT_543021 [Calocera viscosa TUFC12733]|uniref:Uncharacterized protein n=1 Tax=Calocera viscosa (strain TUFC12733) TaxID=1330018 RepID=A0A167G1B6_CALVF|nr:hypothetical protein CALVIDRAFT_543021 [Calocera viscosa TUFC12733]